MSILDLGAIPHEPISAVIDRVAVDHFRRPEPVNFATTHAQMKDITGYMAGDTIYPHVVVDGVEWMPNAFIARIVFLNQNPDLEASELPLVATDEQRVIAGFMFFRFVRTVE